MRILLHHSRFVLISSATSHRCTHSLIELLHHLWLLLNVAISIRTWRHLHITGITHLRPLVRCTAAWWRRHKLWISDATASRSIHWTRETRWAELLRIGRPWKLLHFTGIFITSSLTKLVLLTITALGHLLIHRLLLYIHKFKCFSFAWIFLVLFHYTKIGGRRTQYLIF